MQKNLRKKEQPVPTQGTERPSEKQGVQSCLVFLIDDDPIDRLWARRELRKSEFIQDVLSFSDGQEILEYMKTHGFMDHSLILYMPILIVLDLHMPKKNGLEVMRELKSDPFLEQIPVVFLTGMGHSETKKQALKLGARGFLSKPLRVEMLNTFFKESWIWPPPELWT